MVLELGDRLQGGRQVGAGKVKAHSCPAVAWDFLKTVTKAGTLLISKVREKAAGYKACEPPMPPHFSTHLSSVAWSTLRLRSQKCPPSSSPMQPGKGHSQGHPSINHLHLPKEGTLDRGTCLLEIQVRYQEQEQRVEPHCLASTFFPSANVWLPWAFGGGTGA